MRANNYLKKEKKRKEKTNPSIKLLKEKKMNNNQVTEVGKKTKKLMAKIKEVLDISDDACIQFILLCLMFDVKSMMESPVKSKELESLDEKTLKAIDIVINDEEFKQMLGELAAELEKVKKEKK
jgi:hypothetical protein